MEDVPFAWGAAAKLKQTLLRTASELEGQISSRKSYSRHALTDWRGRYADEFEHEHMAITVNDAERIAAELRNCAEMLHELANLAREERQRRLVAREWKIEHDKWEAEQAKDNFIDDVGDVLGGDGEPQPPDLEEIIPQPMVATAPPCGTRG